MEARAHSQRTGGPALTARLVARHTSRKIRGVRLDPDQAVAITRIARSGLSLDLLVGPAGSGKTTAMRALATAWRNGGGTVVGLAPSAAAAAQLGAQIDTHADTMALLTHALNHRRPLPAWAERIGPTSLVIIDEAGMADTLSLDRVVEFVLDRGGSVRLIGDDQQLAAIGAGGVLRDIQAQHGAVQLNELVRFADPAEGAASLALRAGDPEALGFYLDNHRVHVGDLGTCADQVFDSWLVARQTGADALMVAPTRALVAELSRLPLLGQTPDGKRIHAGRLAMDSALLRELGRLRELTFRAVGEGTGRSLDLDAWDSWYEHIVLWDDAAAKICGAYRIARGAPVLAEIGRASCRERVSSPV